MNMMEAARETINLAREKCKEEGHGTIEPSLQLPHLETMWARMKMTEMSAPKLGRWLGWMQAAVVANRWATLEEMKQINMRYADD